MLLDSGPDAVDYSTNQLRSFWNRLSESDLDRLVEGRIG